MRSTLTINEQKYIINPGFSFFTGALSPEQIFSLNLPIFNWNDYFPEIFESNLLFSRFICNFDSIFRDTNPIKEISLFENQWGRFLSNITQFEKKLKLFTNLNRVSSILEEYTAISNELPQLEEMKSQFHIITKNSLLSSKKNLLEKLNIEYQGLLPKFELQSDEYNVFSEKMGSFEQIKSDFDNLMNIFKTQERDIFQETNQITKKMDEKDPLIQTYNEKLESLDPKEDSADYNRIEIKYNQVKSEYDELKTERNKLIIKSKELKQKISHTKTEYRNKTKESKLFFPQFQTIEKNYLELKKEVDSLKNQIESTQTELQKLISTEKHDELTENISEYSIPYSSESEIEHLLDTKTRRLNVIRQKLHELFSTENITTISGDLDNKISDFNKQITALQNQMKLAEENTVFQKNIFQIIQRTKNFQSIINPLLLYVEKSIRLKIKFIEGDLTKIQIALAIYDQKNSELKFEDLKRVEKTFLGLAFIFTCYELINAPIFACDLNSLPKSMITPQTFSKAISFMQQHLDEVKEQKNSYLFFNVDPTYEVSPILKIAGEKND